METAKVDIRKLQLLNDRINQCIDALNQVRLSVHGLSQGLSHSNPQTGMPPGSLYGYGQAGLGVSPFGQTGVNPFGLASPSFPSQGFGTQGFGSQGFTPGLSHTAAGISPFSQGLNPYLSGVGPESLEAAVRPIWADPILTARISQTFPYAQFPVPPVVSIY